MIVPLAFLVLGGVVVVWFMSGAQAVLGRVRAVSQPCPGRYLCCYQAMTPVLLQATAAT